MIILVMLTPRKQFSFPQFRIPWQESDRFENLEKNRGKPFSYYTHDTLLSIGYPCNYSHVDHGIFAGCTVDHEIMTDDVDIGKGIIFRKNIKEGKLFAKTITQPLGIPNLEYEWKLDKPFKYPDAVEQHQYLTKKFTRNIGLFDVRDYAIEEMCEDLQYNREQIIQSNLLVSFRSRETELRQYIVHPTGPDLERVVMKSLTFTEKMEYSNSEDGCSTCELPFDAPKIDVIQEKQLISRIKSIQYISIENRDIFACRTDHTYYIFEANPINSDESFKQTLEAKFPTEIIASDLSPHIRNEAVVLLQEGLLYIVSKYGSSRLSLPEEYSWISIVFGPHPRFVVCANEKSVFACQINNGTLKKYEKLYKVLENRIVAISRHPNNPYIYALANMTSIFLMDVRQPFIPYFSITPELNGPIEFIIMIQAGSLSDKIKMLVNNRDGELRVFAFSGGVGVNLGEAPNPIFQSEMLLQSDNLGDNLIFLAPDIYFSCRKRFETNCAGSTLILLPTPNIDLTCNIVITVSAYGDLGWQQLLQTNKMTQTNPVIIKPTNEDYKLLIKWMKQGKEQYYRNFNVSEIYFDFLVESMEYFHSNKILEWMFMNEDKCYTCYELKLKFNTKNFPTLSRLHFQSGWTKYSNWSKSNTGDYIPSLRYTRISFKESTESTRKDRFEKRNHRRYIRKMPDQHLAHGCSCLITVDDFVNIDQEEFKLPWKHKAEINESCSELFKNLWESWPSENLISEMKETLIPTTECIEMEEARNEVSEETCDQGKEVIDIDFEREMESVQSTDPFPMKGTKYKKGGTNFQDELNIETPHSQTNLNVSDHSSDLEWPIEWTEMSNTVPSTYPNYESSSYHPSYSYCSLPTDYNSPLSKFPPAKSTPQKQLNSSLTTPKKKNKRKIGF